MYDFQQSYHHKLNFSLVSVHFFSVAFMLCYIFCIICCAAQGGWSEGMGFTDSTGRAQIRGQMKQGGSLVSA